MTTQAPTTITRRVLISFLVISLVFSFFPLLVAWRFDWWQGWVYGIVILVNSILSRLLLARRQPDLLAERAKAMNHPNAKAWDRVLAPLAASLGPLLTLILCGLDRRYSLSPEFPSWLQWGALLLIILGCVLGSWALLENRFFSGVVRIQTERGHTVVDSGPYRIVRHPGYTGALVVYLATPVLLNSLWGAVPALLTIALFVLRTALEDKTLQAELPGYAEYARRTRYRLLPGIW